MSKEKPIYIDVFWHSESRQEQAIIIPDWTSCHPDSYKKGQVDSCWITRKPNKYDKKDCENAVGLTLQPINDYLKEMKIRIQNRKNNLTTH